jgi:hypothetical protein
MNLLVRSNVALFVIAGFVACGGSSNSADNGGGTTLDGGAQSDGGSASSDGGAGPTGGDGGTTTTDGGGSSGQEGGASCTMCARDWSKYPPVLEIDGASELWVMSDAHGDYKTLTTLLSGAGVMGASPATPAAATWSAGAATLVVVGDLIDKGPDAPDVVKLFIALSAAAAKAGGHVVVTMGNHEAEFLADPNNSKATASDGFDPQLMSIGDTPAATAAGSNDVGAFVRDLPFAARVDDWFFCHAGKTDGKTIPQLKSDLQMGVDAMGFGAPVLSDVNSLLEAKLSAGNWWDATNNAQALLTQWTTALGVKHLVMGHQPGAVTFADGTKRAQDQMIQKYGATLFMVDTGMSTGVDATGGALLHVKNAGAASESFEEVLPTGKTKAL